MAYLTRTGQGIGSRRTAQKKVRSAAISTQQLQTMYQLTSDIINISMSSNVSFVTRYTNNAILLFCSNSSTKIFEHVTHMLGAYVTFA